MSHKFVSDSTSPSLNCEKCGESREFHWKQDAHTREQSNETRGNHYQTGRGTLCSLDNDASIRTHTYDISTVTCYYCLNLFE